MSDFKVIDNTIESKNEFGHNYGSEEKVVTCKDLDALLTGKKLLATDINNGEYTLFIRLLDEKEED